MSRVSQAPAPGTSPAHEPSDDREDTAPTPAPVVGGRVPAPRFSTPSEQVVRNYSLYSVVSVVFILVSFLLLDGAIMWTALPDLRWVGIPALLVVFVLSLLLTRGALPLDGRAVPADPPWVLVLATTGVTVVLSVVQAWVDDPGHRASTYTVLVLGMVLSLSVRIRVATLLTVVVAGASLATTFLRHPDQIEAATAGMVLALVGLPIGYFSAWAMEVVRQQARSRHLLADLAVAEERLRFSRDLHDTFGRTLSVVSLKAELGAELARRGRTEEAAAEMDAVRTLTQEGATDVRRVVSGYRNLDPAAELAGARSVLRSGGIEVEVTGEHLLTGSGAWPDATREAVAWTLREAVTNILRHSEARRAELTVQHRADHLQVQVVNDRPHAADPGHHGTGLTGLRERLSRARGHLEHEATDRDFTLTATVPLEESA
ncbi:sensor histidine kinase [Kytococcus sedentarius]|uniref:sensor histidine kinase n=1 Tax=Kytococcus sedentarius TaxID=1276 RepID=UPI0035BBC8FA